MRSFYFYHAETGVLHSNTVVINAPDAETVARLNCPPGHQPIEGNFDPMSQRVDVANPEEHEVWDTQDKRGPSRKMTRQKIVDYQPPAPSADHEWNVDTKRWRLSAAAQAQVQARQAALARIAELEASSVAIMRDLLLGGLSARPRLQSIADQIATLRESL